MSLYFLRRPVLGQIRTNSKPQTQNLRASAVRKWLTGPAGSRTYAVHEPDGRIGTLASMTALIPSRSASMPARGRAGRGVYCVVTTVVGGTDPIEAKAPPGRIGGLINSSPDDPGSD